MFCPKCAGEFVEGITQCPDCEVPLANLAPPPPVDETVEWVNVLQSGDPALISAAQSLMIGSELPWRLRNEQLQELFAWGRLGLGYNPVVGPVYLDVPAENVAEARELLAALEEYPGLNEDELPSGE